MPAVAGKIFDVYGLQPVYGIVAVQLAICILIGLGLQESNRNILEKQSEKQIDISIY